MIRLNEIVNIKGKEYARVNKRMARNMYNKNFTIYFIGNKADVHSKIIELADYKKSEVDGKKFETICNSYEYYNYYLMSNSSNNKSNIHYYVTKKDYNKHLKQKQMNNSRIKTPKLNKNLA